MIMDSFGPLALFAFVATVTPGGATTLATASGARFGLRRSLPLISGIAIGLASLAAAASAGLGGLLLAAPAMRDLLKIAGSVYLLWLALKIARSGPPPQPSLPAIRLALVRRMVRVLWPPATCPHCQRPITPARSRPKLPK